MPNKYYLDVDGVKTLIKKSVESFDKSKNYIHIDVTSVFNPRIYRDIDYNFEQINKSVEFMHKDTVIAELFNSSDSPLEWNYDEENEELYSEKYGDIFEISNINQDIFVRLTINSYISSNEKIDIICNYIETRPATNYELHYTSNANYADSEAVSNNIKVAVFEGQGPLGETYQIIYRGDEGAEGLAWRVFWKDVQPILITSLLYQNTDVEESYVGSSESNPNDHVICGKFIALAQDDMLESDAEFSGDGIGHSVLYNMSSGEYDNGNPAPANMGYAGRLAASTFIKNITRSRVRLLVNSTANQALTGVAENTTIDLYYAGGDWDDNTFGLLAQYRSNDIPTTNGGHIYITIDAYCDNGFKIIAGSGDNDHYKNPTDSMEIYFQKTTTISGSSKEFLVPTLKVHGHTPISSAEINELLGITGS